MIPAFSTGSLYPMEPEKAVLAACDAGFRTLEVFVNCEYEWSDEYIDLFLALLEERGMRVTSIHPYQSGSESYMLFSDYPRRRKEVLESYKKCLRAASRYGARYFILHGPGRSADAFRPLYPHEIEVYRELLAYGGEVGVEVLQENVRRFLSAFPETFRYLAEEIPELGYNLDFKQAVQSGFAIEDLIDAMGGRIRNVHINDLDIANRCRLPGEGRLDYRELFTRLRAVGFDGILVTEVYRRDIADLSRIQVSRLFLESELAKFELLSGNKP
ncbi:MAG: sugar phosphate isomerase/epimerase [Clostridia bacterium]|nr:sugar phosphate isomerase/epimerase [Clostridia bacterium]